MKAIQKILMMIMAMTMVLSFVGCKEETTTPDAADTPEVTTAAGEATTEPEAPTANLEGTLAINGSTSVEKIGRALADEFMALNPDVTITYEATGSSAGIKAAGDKTADIGTSSRAIKEQEKTDYKMDEEILAYDGIAVVSHPSNTVSDLTLDQITAIFKGEITNWKDLGGEDKEIVVVSREEASGTRGAFEELLKFEDALSATAMVVEGNGGVQATVAGNENAIGYVSFASIDESVKAIPVMGIEPTVENVLNSTYQISRPFMMVYFETELSDVAKAFIEFALSEDGQIICEESGAIPVK